VPGSSSPKESSGNYIYSLFISERMLFSILESLFWVHWLMRGRVYGLAYIIKSYVLFLFNPWFVFLITWLRCFRSLPIKTIFIDQRNYQILGFFPFSTCIKASAIYLFFFSFLKAKTSTNMQLKYKNIIFPLYIYMSYYYNMHSIFSNNKNTLPTHITQNKFFH
jgi:hypothetical protein